MKLDELKPAQAKTAKTRVGRWNGFRPWKNIW